MVRIYDPAQLKPAMLRECAYHDAWIAPVAEAADALEDHISDVPAEERIVPDSELTKKEPVCGRLRGLARRGAASSTSCPLGAVPDQKGAFPTNLVSVRTELLADTGSVVSPSWFTEATATPIPSGQHEQQAITR